MNQDPTRFGTGNTSAEGFPPAGDPALPGQIHVRGMMDFGLEDEAAREAHVFRSASRHSQLVRTLRVALPLVGIFIIASIAGAYFYSQANIPDVAIDTVRYVEDKLVMENPRLDGVDEAQRPYSLTAVRAIQNPNSPKQVELDTIAANVPLPDGLTANIMAGNGFFDGDAKRLTLGGDVDVVTEDGMTAKLQDADIDIGAGSLQTQNPVSFTSEQAEISAGSMRVQDNGETVVFETRVRMTLYPGEIRAAQEASDAPKASDANIGELRTGSTDE